MHPRDLKWLKLLEAEINKLKMLVVDLSLDIFIQLAILEK